MVKTTYLQISSPARIFYDKPPRNMFLQPAESATQCAWLYHLVGNQYCWDADRQNWTNSDWQSHFECDNVDISVIKSKSRKILGYCELNTHPDNSIEILYFGLCPEDVGRGMGGPALQLVIGRCRELGNARIWLHTCTLDHPAALANYYKRGFEFWKDTVHDFQS